MGKTAAVAFTFILLILGSTYAAAWFVAALLDLPSWSWSSPVVGAFGWASVVTGAAVGGWVFWYRNPANMISSTYVTFRKMFGRVPVAERSGRNERLVIEGPQRYTRNPLYFAVLLFVFGWGLATASTTFLIWSAVLLAWFALVLIPFEEEELRALFGAQYVAYAERVPMLAPFPRHRRPRFSGQGRA